MIIDRLFIGNKAASEDPRRLKLLRVTHILSATIGTIPEFIQDFTYSSCEIADEARGYLLPRLPTVIQFIGDALESG